MTRSKYRNKLTEVDGIVFHSKGESERYKQLKLMEAAGEISALTRQNKYDLVVRGIKICTYKDDFSYFDNTRVVVEDFKGVRTAVYKLKKKLMLACHGIEIFETNSGTLRTRKRKARK